MLHFSNFTLMTARICCCLLMLGVYQLRAQFPNILLDEQGAPSEPSIVINPTNPDNIVAAAIIDKVYVSMDGGKSWTKDHIQSRYGVWGDPCLLADAKGNVYYLHLSDPTGNNWSSEEILDRIVCQYSADGGKSWSKGGYMGFHHPKDQDKEWAIADPRSKYLYATWTQFDKYGSKADTDKSNILFARSKNKGKKWSKSVRINQFSGNCIDDDGTTEGAVPAVGPNGEVYVAWALNEHIYFDRSTDRGKTWLEQDVVAADIGGGWDMEIPGVGRANGMPVTLCDLSNGPHRGTIYLNFADQRNGAHDTDVWLVKSTDGGNTWSSPKRINDDGPGKHQFFTWMAIDQTTGYLYTVFYDRRNHFGNQTDVYVAYSTDGGEHFVNVKISESPFTPRKGPFFGDYNNISAHAGRICPIWTRMDAQGNTSVWTAVLSHQGLLQQAAAGGE
ncbi:MAG: exo-alpha-sialidase [Bacteroidetes bacterium]|nr:MAG: exo-alpha-sialidase [Bacteroidota bacterium]